MFVFIYTRGQMSYDREEIEDAVQDAFGAALHVTGGGSGTTGSNWDLEILDDSLDVAAVLTRIRTALRHFQLPPNSIIVIDHIEYPLLPPTPK